MSLEIQPRGGKTENVGFIEIIQCYRLREPSLLLGISS